MYECVFKCDTTFTGCDTLVKDFSQYYLNSTPEVQDIIQIAAEALSTSWKLRSFEIKYDPTTGAMDLRVTRIT